MHLLAHPASPRGPVRYFEAHAERGAGDLLRLGWWLDAELSQLRIPTAAAPAQVEGLWRHTCFEAFIARPPSPAYCELNFSPGGEWAAYHFTGYRTGMTPLALPEAPAAVWRRDAGRLELDVVLRLDRLFDGARTGLLRLALSAVIEEQSGAVTYWAIRHPEGKPDFHHSEAFALELAGASYGAGISALTACWKIRRCENRSRAGASRCSRIRHR